MSGEPFVDGARTKLILVETNSAVIDPFLSGGHLFWIVVNIIIDNRHIKTIFLQFNESKWNYFNVPEQKQCLRKL